HEDEDETSPMSGTGAGNEGLPARTRPCSPGLTDQRREPALILWPGDSIRKCSVTEVVHNESCHGIYGDAPITRDGCRNSADIELEVVLVSFSLKPRTLACGNGMTGPRHRIEYE